MPTGLQELDAMGAGQNSASSAGRKHRGLRALGRAVTACPVPKHASGLLDSGLALLLPAALPSALWLAEAHVQCLLLALAEDGHQLHGQEVD